ncbi:DUF1972 domain-containing protein [Thermocrispum municipale]|uniref:DUF1972 domain-containing protein n=1 Tax=Thermocrispum municipale TaxID=37926 RepID=UPI0006949DAC|nr:DUF1972 domain-containing protein [Thermocrispum municipale]
MRIAMIGTRGVPARYGGFETCVEEVGRRLVERGHRVAVYCRTTQGDERPDEHLGMRLVHLPAVRHKVLETLSHTALSVLHARRARPDVAFVFNAGNAPLLPVLRMARIPVATHVDGLEWKRDKWRGAGSVYYRRAESLAVRWSDSLIADSRAIQDYYLDRFGIDSTYIPYGAPILPEGELDRLPELSLQPARYHLVVARFEPENNIHLAVEGYLRSEAVYPLVVVGSAPYADAYRAKVEAIAANSPRVRFLGSIWDQQLLDQLYAGALTYIHGHSVGGTNPSLLRAMGAGAPTSAFDVPFNREVLGSYGRYFSTAAELARLCTEAEAEPGVTAVRGRKQIDTLDRYDWDAVADAYHELALRLAGRAPASVTRPVRNARVTKREPR